MIKCSGPVAQLVRVSVWYAEGHEFNPRRDQLFFIFTFNTVDREKNRCSSGWPSQLGTGLHRRLLPHRPQRRRFVCSTRRRPSRRTRRRPVPPIHAETSVQPRVRRSQWRCILEAGQRRGSWCGQDNEGARRELLDQEAASAATMRSSTAALGSVCGSRRHSYGSGTNGCKLFLFRGRRIICFRYPQFGYYLKNRFFCGDYFSDGKAAWASSEHLDFGGR